MVTPSPPQMCIRDSDDYRAAISCLVEIEKTEEDIYLRGHAQLQIAHLYFLGGGGVPYDDEKAGYWAAKARRSGIDCNDSDLVKGAEDILEEV